MITLAIVDDKQPNRLSLAEKLASKPDIKVLFTAQNGNHFLEQMRAREKKPDVVLMDIDMPELDGVEAVRAATLLYPNVYFVMLTVFDDDNKVFEAIQAGAIGYLLKDEKTEKIEEAVRQVMEYGGAPMSPRIARKTLNLLMNATIDRSAKKETVLSDREMEILKGLVGGLDYKAVAAKLFISPFTVRTHITNIYRKLHVTNKTQAVKLAIKNKWF